MKASTSLHLSKQEAIVSRHTEAEHANSGEVRVHIETSCKGDVLDEAAWLFGKLGMHKTADRNGVLIYLALKERKFAIVGDTGINAVVPLGFWDNIRDHMRKRFSENLFTEGLTEGLIMAGEQLRKHFPMQRTILTSSLHDLHDINERGMRMIG